MRTVKEIVDEINRSVRELTTMTIEERTESVNFYGGWVTALLWVLKKK